MTPQEIISSGLLELYAVGNLSAQERVQVERWRREFPEVAAELISIESAMESYARAAAIPPSVSVKSKTEEAIFRKGKVVTLQPDTSKVISMNRRWMSVAAASISLLLLSSALAVYFFTQYRKSENNLAVAQTQLNSAKSELVAMNSDMGVVKDKYARSVSLDGMDAAPDAAAKIYWMKNSGEVYVDASLMPVAPAGKEYQLWGIVDGKPVNAGMIKSSDGRTFRMQKMKTFGKAEAFAITLEDAGGHEQPRGAMYVMGKI